MESIVLAINVLIDVINDFAVFIYETIMYFLGYITTFLIMMMQSFSALLIDFFDSTMSMFINMSYQLYDLSRIPQLIDAYNDFVLSSYQVCYLVDYLMIKQALISIVTAYLIRFGIRRIPIIG